MHLQIAAEESSTGGDWRTQPGQEWPFNSGHNHDLLRNLVHMWQDTRCSSNSSTARASPIRHTQSFKAFWQCFLSAPKDIPPFPRKGNVTSVLTEIKPGQMVKTCCILALADPKTPSRCSILQLIHNSSVLHSTRISIQPNRLLSLTSILRTFLFFWTD